jgi:hypothetical protein
LLLEQERFKEYNPQSVLEDWDKAKAKVHQN